MAVLKGQNLITFEPLVYTDGKMYEISEANVLFQQWDDENKGKNNEELKDIQIDYFYAEELKKVNCAIHLGLGGRGLIDMLPEEVKQENFPEFIPYLKSHCLLSILEKQAEEKMREIRIRGMRKELSNEYWTALSKYVFEARTALNRDYKLLEEIPVPVKEEFNAAPSSPLGAEKESVLEKLRQFQRIIIDNEECQKACNTLVNEK